MKSVCVLLQNYYDLDIRVRRKAEALVDAGYSVDVLALRSPNMQKTYTLAGVNVSTIFLGKKRGSLARYAFEYVVFFLWCVVRVTVQMARRRYAFIDVNTLPDFLVFAAVFAKWMGAKVILDMHEITPEFYISKYGISENSWWVRALEYQERISFDFADRVITINEPIQDLLTDRGLPREKSIVITNSVDETRFVAPLRSSAASDTATAGAFVLMYHGTLTKLYGLDIAIEAFALAHEEMPGAEIWILGSGTEEGALADLTQQRGLSSKVKLIGQVAPTEIPAWLSRCDIGLLPIRRDVFLEFAFPNKLPEFIITGKPVIVSRLKAIRHYFSEDSLAYFQPNDPEDLAKQMVRIYCNPDLRAWLAAKARQEYAPIRWDVMKDRYLALIKDLVEVESGAIEQSRGSERVGLL
jgi:glycosyltransferase involved in cell wall biosynthesis